MPRYFLHATHLMGTPFLLLISLFFFGLASCSDEQVTPVDQRDPVLNQQDSLALLQLYKSMGGSSWGLMHRWDTDQPVSNWRGVTVEQIDNEYRVTQLWFSNTSEIQGTLSPAIGKLSALQVLSITGRKLTGPIPPEIGSLKDLRFLRFYLTGLSGPIPKEIGKLTRLTDLLIDENPNLKGGVPAEIGQLSQLNYLEIANNEQLSGTLHPEFGNLKKVKIFHMRRNGLTGTIPPELAGMESVRDLDLSANELTGNIPKELAQLNTKYLSLSFNQLTGTIPEEFGDSDIRIWVSANNLSGEIPEGILKRYDDLYLSGHVCGQNPDYGFTNCKSDI